MASKSLFRDVFVRELETKFTTVISYVNYLFLMATLSYQCFLLDRKHFLPSSIMFEVKRYIAQIQDV